MSSSGRCEYCSGRADPKGQRCELCKARQVQESVEHVADREDAALDVFRPPGGAGIPNPSEGGSTPSRFAKRRTQVFIDEAGAFDDPAFEKLCRLMGSGSKP